MTLSREYYSPMSNVLMAKFITDKMKTPILLTIVVLLSAFPHKVYAEFKTWEVDSLTFLASTQNRKIEGNFSKVASSVFLDFDDLKGSSVEIIVDVESLDTEKQTEKEVMLSNDILDVANHRKARFISQEIRHLSKNRYAIKGVLTIRGISRTLNIPFTKKSEKLILGKTSIDRRWFGIGRGEWKDSSKLDHKVHIRYALSTND